MRPKANPTQLKRRLLAGRAFATRDRAGGFAVYRARDRRTLKLGTLSPDDVEESISSADLVWRGEWLEAAFHTRPMSAMSGPALPAIPEAPKPQSRRTALNRVLRLAPSPAAQRAWTEAAGRLAGDVERALSSGIRTMSWGDEMRVRTSDGANAAQQSFQPSRPLSAHRLQQLRDQVGPEAWRDLYDMIIEGRAISPLAKRRGLTRPTMEQRLAELLGRVAETYALALPAEAA